MNSVRTVQQRTQCRAAAAAAALSTAAIVARRQQPCGGCITSGSQQTAAGSKQRAAQLPLTPCPSAAGTVHPANARTELSAKAN